ncbi:hypothetical protein QAD02_017855 [Eretmocerus hayati]|uniref:Uncharacterized protein n=1 Tax=Eretmocerus hayati TaxID=131215 RepID=A0ACC2PG87_9HYME|nr:hypothetical protein QAD02_017855 [Eretmocerus hayati]
MQRHCAELTDRLLQSLDEEYNVVDMGVVVEVITALEKTTITKEVLEVTRLGKHINELRRKTSNEALAKRAKDLVRRWRSFLNLPQTNSTVQPAATDTAPPALNGASTQSAALKSLKPQSPALKGLKPQSPSLKNSSLSRVSSPSLSLHSEQSCSPVISPNKPAITVTNNHRINSNSVQVDTKPISQNHLIEAVPRTHSSNKRLRKDDSEVEPQLSKKPRLNGESVSVNDANLQVPSPALKERNPELVEPSPNPESNEVKKRGRKKGSKSIKKQASLEDSVKEKLASFSRNPKLKTTQELLADLQARGSHPNANLLTSQSNNTSNVGDISRTKKDGDSSKFLSNNQNNFSNRKVLESLKSVKQTEASSDSLPGYPESDTFDEDTRDSVISSQNQEVQPQSLTVEEILAKLPPLDVDSINWEDDEYTVSEDRTNDEPRQVTEEDVERLHTECVEGLNGNFQPKLSSENSETKETSEDKVKFDSVIGLRKPSDSHRDEVFREWHEMLARPSYESEILHILPYVIID